MKRYGWVENGTTLRKATPDELRECERFKRRVAKLKRELRTLYESCPHAVFYDSTGYEYDFRTCRACGKVLDIV